MFFKLPKPVFWQSTSHCTQTTQRQITLHLLAPSHELSRLPHMRPVGRGRYDYRGSLQSVAKLVSRKTKSDCQRKEERAAYFISFTNRLLDFSDSQFLHLSLQMWVRHVRYTQRFEGYSSVRGNCLHSTVLNQWCRRWKRLNQTQTWGRHKHTATVIWPLLKLKRVKCTFLISRV